MLSGQNIVARYLTFALHSQHVDLSVREWPSEYGVQKAWRLSEEKDLEALEPFRFAHPCEELLDRRMLVG